MPDTSASTAENTVEPTRTIVIAHSPDSDDAFMHYAIGEGKVDPGPFQFDHFLSDIETLNRAAVEGTYEVSAISIHGYALLRDRYALVIHGASMGVVYGPVVVAREPGDRSFIEGKTVAIPGEWTSAALALRLWCPGVRTTVVPFDEIIDVVKAGGADAGVVIHEGQLTYGDEGLHRVVDLGVWWAEEEDGLPLPLGGNAIRRDLGEETMQAVSRVLRESIAYALDHREEALDYAEGYGRGLDRGQTDKFVGMYVNQRTLDYGDDGREAVRRFLARGVAAGLVPEGPDPEFIA
ncbi:MAG: menaquinone biosynthesis family protein [Planctomycetota bacterium]